MSTSETDGRTPLGGAAVTDCAKALVSGAGGEVTLGFDVDTRSDAELSRAVGSGDSAAWAELWQRHYEAGLRAARAVSSRQSPEDLVSEAFVRIAETLRKGGDRGPLEGLFRPYLYVTIKSLAARSWRVREDVHEFEELDRVQIARSFVAPVDEGVESQVSESLLATAYAELPQRWQEVLWYTEVEQLPGRSVALLMGLKEPAVAALAYRARRALRAAWIQKHVESEATDIECRVVLSHLGEYSAGTASPTVCTLVVDHLSWCVSCQIAQEDAEVIASKLSLVLLPALLGASAFAEFAPRLGASSAGTAPAAPASPGGELVGSGTASGGAAVGVGTGTWAVVIPAAMAVAVASAGVAVSAWRDGPETAVEQSHSAHVAAEPGAARSEELVPQVPVSLSSNTKTTPVEEVAPQSTTPSPEPEPNDEAAGSAEGSRPSEPVIGSAAVLPDSLPTSGPASTPTWPEVPTPDPTPTPTPDPAPVPTPTPTPAPVVPTPVAEPVLDVGWAGDGSTRPLLTGSGQPGAVVILLDAEGSERSSVRVNGAGRWSLLWPADLPASTSSIGLVVVDDGGARSDVHVVEGLAFAPSLTSPTVGAHIVTGAIDLVIDGWPGERVEVIFDGRMIGAVTLGPTGHVDGIAITAPSGGKLPNGSHTVALRYEGSLVSTPACKVIVNSKGPGHSSAGSDSIGLDQ